MGLGRSWGLRALGDLKTRVRAARRYGYVGGVTGNTLAVFRLHRLPESIEYLASGTDVAFKQCVGQQTCLLSMLDGWPGAAKGDVRSSPDTRPSCRVVRDFHMRAMGSYMCMLLHMCMLHVHVACYMHMWVC